METTTKKSAEILNDLRKLLKDCEKDYNIYCKIFNDYIAENPKFSKRGSDDAMYHSRIQGRMRESHKIVDELKYIISKYK